VDLHYIKGTINIGLIFKKNVTSKQQCIRYDDFDYAADLDKRGLQRDMCLHYPKH